MWNVNNINNDEESWQRRGRGKYNRGKHKNTTRLSKMCMGQRSLNLL